MEKSHKSNEINSKNKMVYIKVDNLMLVNKKNSLSSSFVPPGLVVPKVKFQPGSSSRQMVQEAATALENLFKAAKENNITLIAVSGYRTYERQRTIFNNKAVAVGEVEANKYVAKPGQSEHQTGLAMDILCNEYWTLDSGFANTKAYKWLEKNASAYGFIIRYLKEKTYITGYSYEPWHIRYVGVEHATSIKENRWGLEEYVNG